MDNIKYKFTLDGRKNQSQVSIPVRLNDTAVQLLINVRDGGEPFHMEDGCTSVLFIKKPDGTLHYNSCIIEGNQTIRYDFTAGTADAEGINECEVRVYGTDGVMLTSPRFIMVVSDRVLSNEDTTISDEEKSLIDNIMLAESERNSAELSRASNENTRVSNESTRVSNENARILAESERENASQDAIYKVNEAIANVKDGKDGTDGVSATHSWNGTVLTVTSASGTSSADLKGEKGDRGDTPQKGIDYFTDDDIAHLNIPSVDQTYTPDSENAQSGKAVSEAINSIPNTTWQLLAEYTAEEDLPHTSLIEYGVTAAGSAAVPLDLSGIRVYTSAPATGAIIDSDMVFRCFDANGSRKIAIYATGFLSKNGVANGMIEIKNSDGLWDTRTIQPTATTGVLSNNQSICSGNYATVSLADFPVICGITISARNAAANIPAGTVFKIWGLK